MTREDEIFKLIKQGDRTGLDELVQKYYPEIFKYCFWHTSNRADAEDATQETFLKAVRYLDRYMHRGKFRAFLYQVAANTCIDMSRKKREELLPDEQLEQFSALDEGLEKVIEEEDFIRLIRHLPDEAGELIFLRYGQSLKYREIAVITGMGLRTVQSRLRAAVKELKEILQLENTKGEYRDSLVKNRAVDEGLEMKGSK